MPTMPVRKWLLLVAAIPLACAAGWLIWGRVAGDRAVDRVGDVRPPAEQPPAEPPGARPPGGPHFYKGVEVVCVGIDAHSSPKVRNLNQAVKDAKDVAGALESKYGYKPTLLLNRDATKTAILAALDELDARPTPPEAVVLYFACHGITFDYPNPKPDDPVPVRVGYLIPHDAGVDLKDTSRPEQWEKEAIGMRELVDRIERMKARHVVLIADTCCSGYLAQPLTRGVSEAPELVRLLSDPSRTVLAATTQQGSAVEGVFTPELLKILGAADADPRSVTDVFQQVRAAVSQNARGTRMLPQMARVGSGDGEFVFIPARVNDGEVTRLAGQVEEYRRTKQAMEAGGLVSFQAISERQQKRQGRQSRLSDVVAAVEAEDYRYSANAEAEAARWEGVRRTFAENAALGDVWAMAGLHFCYARGLGCDVSAKDAYFWARQAGQFAKPPGLGDYLLARCYELGLGVAKNEVAAEKLYQAAAEAKLPLALLRRGEQVAGKVKPTGPPLPAAERAAAEKDLRAAYDAGVTSASVPLFRFYVYDPNSDLKTNAPIVKMLEKAAGQNVAEAHQILWLVYAKGTKDVPPKDLTRAKEHLTQAAKLGRASSQRVLAIEYYRNTGGFFTVKPALDLPQNFREARLWAELAARQNDAGGHFLLAQMYRAGSGVTVDHDKYRTHLDAAGQLKWSAAMHELFWELCRGKLYKQDFARAVQTAEESAGLGHATGHYNLGYYYLAILNPVTKKEGLREGVEKFLLNDHANTYRVLHHYWQAYKIDKHPGAKRFLEDYWVSHVKNLGNLKVDNDLEKHYPETAKELFATTDFDKKK